MNKLGRAALVVGYAVGAVFIPFVWFWNTVRGVPRSDW